MKRKAKKTTRSKPNWHQAVIADHHRLSAHPGVQSVALGLKEVRGKVTKKYCVKIYVARKLDQTSLAKEAHLPKRARVLLPSGKGTYRSRFVPTDIVELPSVELARNSTDPFQDIPMGAQVGTGAFGGVGPGTQGCVVRHRLNNKLALLTAAHVVASVRGPITPGIPVFQPDVASPNFAVGPTITGFLGNDLQLGAYVDVVIYEKSNNARTAQNASFDGRIPNLNGSISLAQTIQTAVAVHKVGAVTGYTIGLFSAFHQNFTDPSLGALLNVLEFVVDPRSPSSVFADLGDSGAAIVSRSPGSFGAVVGILFARSPDKTRALVIPFEFIQRRAAIDVA
jgi:hypothetical protein